MGSTKSWNEGDLQVIKIFTSVYHKLLRATIRVKNIIEYELLNNCIQSENLTR